MDTIVWITIAVIVFIAGLELWAIIIGTIIDIAFEIAMVIEWVVRTVKSLLEFIFSGFEKK